jgi:hypothetical protein
MDTPKHLPAVFAALLLLLMGLLAGGAALRESITVDEVVPMPGYSDARLIFLNCIRDSKQLQPTMDKMLAQYEAEQAKRAAQLGHH